MKNLKSILLIATMIFVGQFVYAGGVPTTGSAQAVLSQAIVSQIDFPRNEMEAELKTQAKLIFRITDNKRIEILNVESSNADVAEFLTETLNGQKISIKDKMAGHKYEVNISFEWL